MPRYWVVGRRALIDRVKPAAQHLLRFPARQTSPQGPQAA